MYRKLQSDARRIVALARRAAVRILCESSTAWELRPPAPTRRTSAAR